MGCEFYISAATAVHADHTYNKILSVSPALRSLKLQKF